MALKNSSSDRQHEGEALISTLDCRNSGDRATRQGSSVGEHRRCGGKVFFPLLRGPVRSVVYI